MELFSINSSYSVNSTTAVNLDHSPEAWTVAVPVIFVLICTGVTVTIVILLFLFWYKKVHRRGVVAPAPGTNTISNGGPTSNVSKTISNRGQVPPNGFRRVSNGGPVQGSVRKPSKSEFLKKSSFNTTVSFDDDEGDPLAVTRTQSLTVLVPVGKMLSDVFSSDVDTGEFQEPDQMGGKLRWQVILLEPAISEQHSDISLSDDESVSEFAYRQGVYLEWTNTLADLRTAFIDTNQIDEEERAFCFLWSDVLGEHIDIAAESGLQLSKLGHAAARNRTVYIEGVDPGAVQKSLCVCGKHATFQCVHCKNRGYCSHDCEQVDTIHIIKCSVNVS